LFLLTNPFTQELGTRLDELAQQYVDVCRDLERERVAGRLTQQRAEAVEGKLKVLEECTVSVFDA
jgi:hypothetical protein